MHCDPNGQGNDTVEKMVKINVMPSMPALLVFMFQVGSRFLLVKGKLVITIVCASASEILNDKKFVKINSVVSITFIVA